MGSGENFQSHSLYNPEETHANCNWPDLIVVKNLSSLLKQWMHDYQRGLPTD